MQTATGENEFVKGPMPERSGSRAWARARTWAVFAATSAGASGTFAEPWARLSSSLPALTLVLALSAVVLAWSAMLTPVRSARPARWSLALLACVALGLAAGEWSRREPPRDSLVRHASPGAILIIEGLVATTPTLRASPQTTGFQPTPSAMCEVLVRGVQIEGSLKPASGRVRVLVSGGMGSMTPRAGDRVRVMGVYTPPSPRTNPGEPPRLDIARATGDAGTIRVSSWELVSPAEALAHPRVFDGITRRLLAARARAQRALLDALPDEPRARWLLGSLLLGVSEGRNDEAMSAMARIGAIHLVAISGFHLTVVAMVLLALLRLLGDRGWLEPVLVLSCLLAYALLTPLSPALLRAVLMTSGVIAAQASGRKTDPLCVLALVGVLMVLWSPLTALDLGFQLSVGMTALLLWAQEPFARRFAGLPPKGVLSDRLTLPQWLWRSTRLIASASVLCWLVSTPWLMARVGLVSPVGVLASLLLGPLFLVLLVVGFLAALLGSIAGALGLSLDWTGVPIVLSRLSDLTLWGVRTLDALPASSLWTPPTPWWWALLASLSLAAWARFGVRAPAPLAARRAILASLAGCALALPILWDARTRLPRDVAIRVDMLDVGDGTCMLVRTHDATILWDAKPARWAGTRPGVLAACRALGIWRVPTVAISHPDSDHLSGLPELLRPLGIRRMLTSPRTIEQGTQPGTLTHDVLARARAHGVSIAPLHAGEAITFGRTSLIALGPAPGLSPALPDNEHSLVLRVESRGRHIVLTGDVQGQPARDVLARLSRVPVDVLELPHHGSPDAGAIALVMAARPTLVLQSTGPSRLNDPRLDAARTASQAWLVTARDGACFAEILLDGKVRYGSTATRD